MDARRRAHEIRAEIQPRIVLPGAVLRPINKLYCILARTNAQYFFMNLSWERRRWWGSSGGERERERGGGSERGQERCVTTSAARRRRRRG